jgi:hypothetical protein
MVAAFFIPIPGPKLIWQFGELGYDYGINRCEDGTYNNNCRLSPKPIRWDYYQDANRRALYNVYANLNRLKTNPLYASTFTGSNITWDLSSAVKWMKINGPSINLMIIGNFDVGPQSGTVTFQSAGTWYSYLTGTTITATGGPQIITLQPGEYYVYTNVNVPLPLKLVSFTGTRNTTGASLNWTTTNEVNVKDFELQRSVNGTDFTTVYTKNASGNNSTQLQAYQYTDKDDVVLSGKTVLYYRLKMNDADGNTSYSKLVMIGSSREALAVALYPNPVSNSILQVQLAGALLTKTELQVQDISGRILSRQYVNAGVYTSAIPVNVAAMPTGMYRLKIISGPNVTIKPFTVQH